MPIFPKYQHGKFQTEPDTAANRSNLIHLSICRFLVYLSYQNCIMIVNNQCKGKLFGARTIMLENLNPLETKRMVEDERY